MERVQGGAGEDFAVILCGYEEEMDKMINAVGSVFYLIINTAHPNHLHTRLMNAP